MAHLGYVCIIVLAVGSNLNYKIAVSNGLLTKRQAGANEEPPSLTSIPRGLKFSCRERLPGYYADPRVRCQVWHWCLPNGYRFSFLCPNNTMFNQQLRVCDWWYRVPCEQSEQFYDINTDLYKDLSGNFI